MLTRSGSATRPASSPAATDDPEPATSHINPYTPPHRGGPPGQTHPGNLAPLCHHHRAKTHSTWHYQRHPDHSYHWTSPTGHAYVVLPARPPGSVGGAP